MFSLEEAGGVGTKKRWKVNFCVGFVLVGCC